MGVYYWKYSTDFQYSADISLQIIFVIIDIYKREFFQERQLIEYKTYSRSNTSTIEETLENLYGFFEVMVEIAVINMAYFSCIYVKEVIFKEIHLLY